MSSTPPGRHGDSIGPRLAVFLLALFVLVGINLRTVLLGVPPILPLIQRDLTLSHTGIALLTALPVLAMGAGAWPAGLLMSRFGGRWTVALGLLIVGLGAMLRGLWTAAAPLYIFTVVLSLGIAFAQTSVVALVRVWFPRRVGLASALYTDGIISGEALGAGLTLPLLLHWFGPSAWRASLVAWGVPVLVVLVLWLLVAPPGRTRQPAEGGTPGAVSAERQRLPRLAGRPFWLLAVHIGLLSGAGSLIYFNMNAWTAPYNSAVGHPETTALSLAVLNSSQLPVCLSITPVAQRLTGRRLPFAISGVLCLVAMAGWAWTPAVLQPLWAAVFGGSTVAVLVLGIALPPYFATPATVARLVGAALSISYLVSFSGQLAGGRLWDLTGGPIFAFLPVVAASVLLLLLAAMLPKRPATEPSPIVAVSGG